MKLTDSDPNDDDKLCTVIIAVMQKYRRELKNTGVENLAIGFAVYEATLFWVAQGGGGNSAPKNLKFPGGGFLRSPLFKTRKKDYKKKHIFEMNFRPMAAVV